MTDIREPVRNEPQPVTQDPVNLPPTPEAAQPDTPWNAGAEHFTKPEDAVKSYKELQRITGDKDSRIAELEAQIAAAATGQPEIDPQGGDPTSPVEQPGDAAKPTESKIEWDSLDGYIDEETKWYKPEFVEDLAESHGLPKEIVETHMEEVKFLREFYQKSQQQEALDFVGGQENFQSMLAWATDNAPEAIPLLDSPTQWRVALSGLKNLMQEHGAWPGQRPTAPQEPSQAPGTGTGTMSEAPLSRGEFAKMTQDPRYNTDQAWTENVQQRYAAGRR